MLNTKKTSNIYAILTDYSVRMMVTGSRITLNVVKKKLKKKIGIF